MYCEGFEPSDCALFDDRIEGACADEIIGYGDWSSS